MEIRKANVKDVPEMQALINQYADKGELLPRSLNQLYENLREFILMEEDGRIIGTCALHICWGDLAEIKALVVDESYQRKGYGRSLVQVCMNEALELGISKVFALTYKPEFFKKIGYSDIDKSELPQKVWTECIHCVKFPNCGESAVIRDLE
ncbi:N-acetyltransferase [uncultured Desulfobulbus sp.]|uniref:N-acetyltransferase n=1 Tax=uncultured Desulfobulbus sp. TaxID=239745 RepID=UPI0029C747F6|nr:N-acetyltransferase [uncultured Desulfobulbus sp.]